MTKKKKLTKQFTRDFSLYSCEWLREGLHVSFEKKIGAGYMDYVIVGNAQNITTYYEADDLEAIRIALLKKMTKDHEWYFQQSKRFRRECLQSRLSIERAVVAGVLNKRIIEQSKARHVRLFPMLRLSILVPTVFSDDIRSQFGAYGESIINTAYEDRKKSDGVFEMNDYNLRQLIAERLASQKIPTVLAKLFTMKELSLFSKGKAVDFNEIKKRAKGYVLCNFGLFVNSNYQKVFVANNYFFKEEKVSGSSLTGNVAFGAIIVRGKVRLLFSLDQIHTFKKNEIMVTPMTVPDFLPAMKKATAIVTDEGGITCHAAIVARELKKPCVIGTKIATKVFKDGDLIEVDATKGIVKKIK
ncbi:hypothetical protein KJ810_04315 [Patescibacteria group bacterium]|nr:hypothetical protein [Patescibacteria group bacterium]